MNVDSVPRYSSSYMPARKDKIVKLYETFMKNRELPSDTKRMPYEAMFGCDPRVGLSTTHFPRGVVFDAVEGGQQLGMLFA
ncbi:hypothetical protein TNCT_550671 [Trichonephila clavata]|uniref:Uncharacterized protein n=1 Tax=Trichonephila clavata TaxID=2740835 RepID=A0A8X6KYT9_TRICU|nr:hypothetical protein TNCT_550671 [Trichonephila clavata]